MGMDYKYAGSASYPRFDKEISDIVTQVLGGCKSNKLIQKENSVKGDWVSSMFGTASNMKDDKYVFPDDVPGNVAYFFNHLYDKHSPGFMNDVYLFLSSYFDKISKISNQFVTELEMIHSMNEFWKLS